MTKVEFKGTKGDWRHSHEFDCITTSRPGIIEGSKTICNLNMSPSFDYSGQEARANAKLISKAPEMLQMIQILVDAIESEKVILAEEYEMAVKLLKEATEI
jgi:hypothetical protein